MKIKVGLADDNPKLLQAITKGLSQYEHIQLEFIAINGQEVLENLGNKSIDVMLMDINMPVMNGIDATQKLKEKYPDINEQIGGRPTVVLNLKSSIIFSIVFLGSPLIFFLILFVIRYEFLLLNSQILSGFLPKIVYLPLILPFSTDSKIKLFFSSRKLSIKFKTS